MLGSGSHVLVEIIQLSLHLLRETLFSRILSLKVKFSYQYYTALHFNAYYLESIKVKLVHIFGKVIGVGISKSFSLSH